MIMGAEATAATVASASKNAGSRPLDGKVALVSGGGRGLGRLLSVRLADAGAAVGLTEVALRSGAGQQTPGGRVHRWIRDQFAAGRGADPEEAARLVLALASGHADRLSGCHLSVTETLNALLARIEQIQRDDLYTLRLRT